jgi:drug/metabolite transporter (DMT)-like permease
LCPSCALIFGELNRLSATQFAVLGASLVIVLVGVLLIVGSQDRTEGSPEPERAGSFGRGIIWATAAGILWGTYFVPAQWARVPSQVSDFPLAPGILVAGVALVLHGGNRSSSLLTSPR